MIGIFDLFKIGSGLFFALRQADMPSNRIFLVIAGLCAAAGLAIVLWLRGHTGPRSS